MIWFFAIFKLLPDRHHLLNLPAQVVGFLGEHPPEAANGMVAEAGRQGVEPATTEVVALQEVVPEFLILNHLGLEPNQSAGMIESLRTAGLGNHVRPYVAAKAEFGLGQLNHASGLTT